MGFYVSLDIKKHYKYIVNSLLNKNEHYYNN